MSKSCEFCRFWYFFCRFWYSWTFPGSLYAFIQAVTGSSVLRLKALLKVLWLAANHRGGQNPPAKATEHVERLCGLCKCLWHSSMRPPNLCVLFLVHASALELWIFFTTTLLRVAWNSPNLKSPANMRVLRGLAHLSDLQCVAKISFAKRTIFLHETSSFEQLWAAFVLRLVLNQSGFTGISNWVMT